MVGCFQGEKIRVKNISTPAFKKKHGNIPFPGYIFKKLLNSNLHKFQAKKKLLKNVPVTSIIYVFWWEKPSPQLMTT